MNPVVPGLRPQAARPPIMPVRAVPVCFGQKTARPDFQAIQHQLARRRMNLPNAALDTEKGDVAFSAHDYLKALAEVRREEARPGFGPGVVRALRSGGRRMLGMNEDAVPAETVLRKLGAGFLAAHSAPYHIETIREEARMFSFVRLIITPLVQEGLLAPSGFSRELDSPSGRTGVHLHAGYALTRKGLDYLAAVSG